MNFSDNRIGQFINLARTTVDTTILIQRIAEERFFLQCCAAVMKPANRKDTFLNELGGALERTAEKQLYPYKELREKLAPVAIALGLQGPASDSLQTDYYRILGTRPSATEQEIKAAYRQKARAYHPDTGSGDNDRFIRAQEAYEVLSSQPLRHQYDLSRNTALKGKWQEGPELHSPVKDGYTNWGRLVMPFMGIILLLAAIAFVVDAINQDFALTNDVSPYPLQSPPYPPTDKKSGYIPAGNTRASLNGSPAEPPRMTIEPNREPDPAEASGLESEGPDKDRVMADIPESDLRLTSPPDETPGKNQTDTFTSNVEKELSRKKEEAPPSGNDVIKQPPQPVPFKPTEKAPAIHAKTAKLHGAANSPSPPPEATPIVETAPPPAAAEPSRNMAGRLFDFLQAYCKTYENQDLDKFIFFFTDYAEENGVLFQSLLPTYRQNFRNLENIQYQIEMNNYLWDLDKNTVQVEGDFILSWKKKQENTFHEYAGEIRMDLILFKDSFLVENLTYRFRQ